MLSSPTYQQPETKHDPTPGASRSSVKRRDGCHALTDLVGFMIEQGTIMTWGTETMSDIERRHHPCMGLVCRPTGRMCIRGWLHRRCQQFNSCMEPNLHHYVKHACSLCQHERFQLLAEVRRYPRQPCHIMLIALQSGSSALYV